MKIPLPELGLDCEKIKACPFHTKDTIGCSYCNEDNMYNTRTAENEKSVLVIDREKMAGELYLIKSKGFKLREDEQIMVMEECYREVDVLSQNAKSFMSIQKE